MTNLVHDILERVGAVDCEADEEKVGLWIRQWSQSVIFFLSSGVPKR